MSLSLLDWIGLGFAGVAVLGVPACVIGIIYEHLHPQVEEVVEEIKPVRVRPRIRATVIVPRAEAHTLPRFLSEAARKRGRGPWGDGPLH